MTPEYLPDDLEEFLERLDLYGGQLENWPVETRGNADAVLIELAEARAHLVAMRRAETALAQLRTAEMQGLDTFAARAMQAPQIQPRRLAIRRLSWAAAGTVALVAGLFIGAMPGTLPSEQKDASAADVAVAVLGQPGEHDVW